MRVYSHTDVLQLDRSLQVRVRMSPSAWSSSSADF